MSKRAYTFVTRKPREPHPARCEECGKTFDLGPHWQTRPRRFCSNPCRIAVLNRQVHLRLEDDARKRSVTPKGYIRLWVIRDGKSRQIMEHRLVMEKVLGRRLAAAERVHHIDGHRANNHPSNLRLYATQAEHMRVEHATQDSVSA